MKKTPNQHVVRPFRDILNDFEVAARLAAKQAQDEAEIEMNERRSGWKSNTKREE